MIIIIKNFFQSGRLSCLQEVSFQHLPGLSAVIIIVIIIVNIVIIVINVMITFEKIRLAYPSCSPPPPPSPPSPAGDVRLQRKQGRPLQRFLHFPFFLLSHNCRFLLSYHFLSSVFSLSPVFIFTQVVPRFCPASYSLFSLFPHKLWPLARFCQTSYSLSLSLQGCG